MRTSVIGYQFLVWSALSKKHEQWAPIILEVENMIAWGKLLATLLRTFIYPVCKNTRPTVNSWNFDHIEYDLYTICLQGFCSHQTPQPTPMQRIGNLYVFLLCSEVYQKRESSASFVSLSTALSADLLVLSLSRLVPSAKDTLKAPALVGSLFRPDRYRIVMNYIHELSSIDPLNPKLRCGDVRVLLQQWV